MTEIIDVTAREILDSRGNSTVEVEMTLSSGDEISLEIESEDEEPTIDLGADMADELPDLAEVDRVGDLRKVDPRRLGSPQVLDPLEPVPHEPRPGHLASQGLTFTRFHASPVCSVTRAMLLTGNDPIQVGLGAFDYAVYPPARGRPGYEAYLTRNTATIADHRDGARGQAARLGEGKALARTGLGPVAGIRARDEVECLGDADGANLDEVRDPRVVDPRREAAARIDELHVDVFTWWPRRPWRRAPARGPAGRPPWRCPSSAATSARSRTARHPGDRRAAWDPCS